MPAWKKVIVSGSDASLSSLNVTNGVTGSLLGTSSYSNNADLLDGKDSSTFATTGSNIFIGTQTVTGSLFTTGSNTLIGSTSLTGSLNITGSTTQVGNNTLLGNTTLSGSIIISGSTGPGAATASVQIYGDIRQTGYHRFDPVTTNIDTSISASYIFVSGSTNDLYFSQNGSGFNNVTRLRWLESNLYTGLLNGGIITAVTGSTVYQVSSGSGIIVNLNASLSDNPYPTIKYINWGNLSASIAPLTASYQQAFVAIDSTGNIYQQGTPFSNGQFDTEINIGLVLFQNGSTINGVKTQPSVAYGFEQSQNIFNRAFGPLKLSGYTLAPSGSSTRSLIVASGTAYSPGSNYTIDPNEPSYTTDSGTNISKIFRYRQSGSTWVYDTNAGAGYTTIDPTQYSNNGVLTAVPGGGSNREFSIQRVFYFPNSVAKAIVVYYGNATYASLLDATSNISFESFVEAPNTAANAIYLGAIVVRNDATFTDTDSYAIQLAGLFRSVGGSGGGGSVITQTLSGLSDVLISGPTSGQALVYDSTAAKWENKSFISASISGNAATATSASYAATASFTTTAQTASSADNFTVRGTLTAQTIVAQTITSSTDFVTGSTRFGSLLTDTHQFTGSVSITGSLNVVGAGITGSLFGTASWANNATTASYIANVVYTTGSQNISGFKTFTDRATFNNHIVMNGSGSTNYTLAFKQPSALNFYSGDYTEIGAFGGTEINFNFGILAGGYRRFAFNVANLSLSTPRTYQFPDKTGTLLIDDITTGSVATASFATSASFAPTAANVFLQGGNSFGAQALLGTNDAQNLAFETSGSVRMLISGSNGNVGIGTTSPTYKLDVSGSNTRLVNSGGSFELDIVSSAVTSRITSTTSVFALGSLTNHPVIFWTNADEKMRIAANGNVGIGTTAPTTKLEIYNATEDRHFLAVGSGPSINFGNTNSGPLYYGTVGLATTTNQFIQGAIAGDLAILSRGNISGSILFGIGASASNEKMRITPTGNVGIGTTSPAATLHVSGTVSIGATSVSSEGNLFLGPKSTTEGGQMFFQAGTSYTSASMLDVYQSDANPYFRILRGTNTASDSLVAQFNLHTKQFILPAYTSTASFAGTATAYLAVDATGSVITVAGSGGGGSVSGGSTNYVARWASSTSLTTGSLFDNGTNVGIGTTTASYKLDVSGDIRATGAVYANANGAMYFRGGDDVELWDINVSNTIGVYGQQDQGVASIKLGSGGGIISGRSGSIGIGTTSPARIFTINGGSSSSRVLLQNTSSGFTIGNGFDIVLDNSGNTQVWNYQNGVMQFATNNSERMRIDAGGNVGIGTTSPATRLDINGRLSFTSASISTIFAERNGNYHIIYSPAANPAIYMGNASDPANYYDNGSHQFRSAGGGTYYAVITSAGSVGIGTTAPAVKLSVVGGISITSGNDLTWGNVAYGAGVPTIAAVSGSSAYIAFYPAGSTSGEKVKINSDGNVGIGTTSPLAKLHVAGELRNSFGSGVGGINYLNIIDGVSNGFRTTITTGNAITYTFHNGANSGVFNILESGNVGIGTTGPTSLLDVRSGFITAGTGTSVNGSILMQGYYSNGALTTFGTMYSSGGPVIGYAVTPSTTADFSFLSSTGLNISRGAYYMEGGSHIWYSGGTQTVSVGGSVSMTELMRISNGGNVGINTTSPQDKLTVRGATNYNLNLGMLGSYSAIYVYNDASNAYKELRIDAAPLILQSYSGGNVGINTSAPIAKLDVEGDFQLLNANYNSYSSSVSGTTTLATIPTSSYNGVFFDFVAFSGSNQRAGTLIGNWRSGNVQYTEYSTPDIGSTAAALTMSVALSGANALVQSVSAPGWAIKATYRTV
jgi:hypothetical protein